MLIRNCDFFDWKQSYGGFASLALAKKNFFSKAIHLRVSSPGLCHGEGIASLNIKMMFFLPLWD